MSELICNLNAMASHHLNDLEEGQLQGSPLLPKSRHFVAKFRQHGCGELRLRHRGHWNMTDRVPDLLIANLVTEGQDPTAMPHHLCHA